MDLHLVLAPRDSLFKGKSGTVLSGSLAGILGAFVLFVSFP